MRIEDPTAVESNGWERFGQVCSAGRRSLWVRFTYKDPETPYREPKTIEMIEICGGREGDDLYFAIPHTNPDFAMWVNIITAGLFSVET